jgi:hypothetical protein
MATVRRRVRIAAGGEEKIAWVADYHGKRHKKTFPIRKAARAWLVEAQGEVSRGVHTPERSSLNIYEACQLWLQRGTVEELEQHDAQLCCDRAAAHRPDPGCGQIGAALHPDAGGLTRPPRRPLLANGAIGW